MSKIKLSDRFAELDRVIKELTAFGSFYDLVSSHKNYRPSVDVGPGPDQDDLVFLADEYDSYMAEIKDKRRAYRYGANRVRP